MATGDWPVESVKQLIVARGNPDRLLVLTPQQGVFALPLDPEANGTYPKSNRDFGNKP